MMNILVCIILLFVESTNTYPDSLIKYVSGNDTLYITYDDVLYVDNTNERCWTFQLSERKSKEFDSLNYEQGKIFFFVNGTWNMLNEYEQRGASIPVGYYIITDHGKISFEKGEIQIGYYKPSKKKKLNKFQRKLLYG